MYVNSIKHLKTYLCNNGYMIVDQDRQYRDVRPYLVVWHSKSDTMVYIDLRVFEPPLRYVSQRWYMNWMHRRKVKNEFNKWRRICKWRGRFRFDIAEMFPTPGCLFPPGINHIVDVKM